MEDTNEVESAAEDNINKSICLKGVIANAFTDVDVVCNYPPERLVVSKIREIERSIVKISGSTDISPNASTLRIDTLPDSGLESIAATLKEKGISELLVPHKDTCAGNPSYKPLQSGEDIFNNIKAIVDTFDIYTKCTKVYVPNQENGKPKMRKDDIIVIVTGPVGGPYTLSYEDVTEYTEFTDNEGTKTLKAIISSRKKNVIEGNYDVTVRLFRNQTVRLSYVKRQNLAENLVKMMQNTDSYIVSTQDSVDRTILKLAYAGLYGANAVGEKGCYERKWCADYSTKLKGESCNSDLQCVSGRCQKKQALCLFFCKKICA